MTKVLVTESYLEDIADAIRAKLDSSDTYTPGQMAAGIQSIPTGGSSGITKVEMASCPQQCYLYTGGTRGWAVYPTSAGAQGAETFYADIPTAFQNGGMIILSTARPTGATYEFTRNRIGFTDGTEDVSNLPDGQNPGVTTQPAYYMNAMSQDKAKQFSMVRVPSGMRRVYWTNTQATYRVAGQKSYMWLIEDADLLSALNIDWKYYINDAVSSANETTNEAWLLQ